MSGLLALLDDVAAIAKLAAAQVDDIAAQAAKAGSKAAGVVIDDAAVTPRYVTGLPAARELPIVWRIARASFFNKLVILLPAALLLQAFAPWLLTPLLMLGGAYLAYEGAEKVLGAFLGHEKSKTQAAETLDAAHLEETRVRGAIKTDFILSAEILAITLSAIDADAGWIEQAAVLAVVSIAITAVVYGVVAALVKADDVGLRLAQDGPNAGVRAFGRGLVRSMPTVLATLGAIGAAAMLWIGGELITKGLKDLGLPFLYDAIAGFAARLPEALGGAAVIALDAVVGLVIGAALVLLMRKVISPLTGAQPG